MSDERFVYVTCESKAQAREIGQTLVGNRLAACANILPGMESIYWWEGKLESAKEVVLILKSRAALLDTLTASVRQLHSYDVPCVVALPIEGGNPDYLRWIHQETEPNPPL